MFETAFPVQPVQPLLAMIAAMPAELSARVERLEAQLSTVAATRPEPEAQAQPTSEWIWEGNRARRAIGRPLSW